MSKPDDAYDIMGIEYAEKNATSLANAYYERPAMISLLPNLADLRVVDAGCGSGTLTEYIVNQGANVIGFDISEVLVGYTKQKLSDNKNVLIRVGDFSKPLDFIESGTVDLVTSSLVLHYIEDWTTTLQEVERILKPNGQFIFSIHHPVSDWKIAELETYFDFNLIEDIWTINDKEYKVNFYHRTLTRVFEEIQRSGLYVDSIHEPQPLESGKHLNEEWFRYLVTHPHFLFLKLKKL